MTVVRNDSERWNTALRSKSDWPNSEPSLRLQISQRQTCTVGSAINVPCRRCLAGIKSVEQGEMMPPNFSLSPPPQPTQLDEPAPTKAETTGIKGGPGYSFIDL